MDIVVRILTRLHPPRPKPQWAERGPLCVRFGEYKEKALVLQSCAVEILGGLGSLGDRKISVGMSVSGTPCWGPCYLGIQKSLRWTR